MTAVLLVCVLGAVAVALVVDLAVIFELVTRRWR
jgi:hypothetical protein